jgi:DNA-binding CsgD family transcriptional regulator
VTVRARASGRVFGRESELAAVDALLADTAPGPHALLLEGEAGIGKSTVWNAGTAAARDRGWTVLAARGSQSETGLSFAGLTDMLDPVVDEILADLPEPQRIALEVAMVRRLPGEVEVGPREVGTALLAVLRRLSEAGSVLLALDDVPWIDRATVDAVRFALRRLQVEPVRILASRRTPGGVGAEEEAAAVVDVLPPEAMQVRSIGPVDAPVLDRMLADRLQLRLPSRILGQVVEQTGGNPFWALEVGATLASANAVSGGVPIPESLSTLVAQRLSGLPGNAHEALLVVSALAAPTSALAEAGLRSAVADPAAAIAAAVDEGAIVDSDGRLRPAHPLLGSAALDGLPPVARTALHERLAAVVTDPEQRARHLVLAAGEPPNAELADVLEAGAAAARSRGATYAALELAESVLRFTPAQDTAALSLRRTEAAELHYMAGDNERVCELAEAVWSGPDPGPDVLRRVVALLPHALLYARGHAAAQRIADEAVERAGDDALVRSIALAGAAEVHTVPKQVLDYAQQAIALSDQLGESADQAALAKALLSLAEMELFLGNGFDRELAIRAAQAEAKAGWIPFVERAEVTAGFSAKYADDLDTSRDALTRMLVVAQDEAELASVPVLLGHLAMTEVWAARYDDARRHLAAVDAAKRETGPGIGEPASLSCARALVLIMDDDLDGAHALLTTASSLGPRIAVKQAALDAVLGLIALLRGEDEEAITKLSAVLVTCRAEHMFEPGVRQRPEGNLGQALVNTGRLDEAVALADELRELGRRGDRPNLTGIAHRIDGLVLAARGDLDGAVTALTVAVRDHEHAPLPLEYGRSLLALGQVLRRRRARSEAQTALRDALECFTSLGAVPFARMAQAELGRAQSTRSATALTTSEKQVAELVASGMTNREVAGRLFASVRTVEGHLAAVYRKLGVRSRTELAARFAAEVDDSAEPR